MKKRILAFVLCVLTCVSTFTLAACSGNSIDELNKQLFGDVTTSENDQRTICIYGITDKATTETAIAEVEQALNQISVRKYNTKVKLLLFPEETYASIVLNKLQTSVNAYNTQLLDKADDEEKKLIKNIDFNSNDMVKVSASVPSDVLTATMDIFLVYNPKPGSETLDPTSEYYNPILRSNGMFDLVYEAMALAPLKTKLSTGTYSALRSNSYPEALKFVTKPNYKSMGKTENITEDIFAVPNNYVYGGYKYVIVNNDIVNDYISSENIAPDFDSDVGSQSITNSNVRKALVKELNAVGAEALGVTEIERTQPFTSYEEFSEASKTETYAIAYADGDLAFRDLVERGQKYSVYKLDVPRVEVSDLCESMYCISKSATPYLDRCLDILLLINTDATFRNILQYGVKDTHYNEGRDGTIYVTGTTTDRYIMDPKYTGNMFILTPSDSMSASERLLAANKWKLGKLQVSEVLSKYNGK